jgi:hypothetical protein
VIIHIVHDKVESVVFKLVRWDLKLLKVGHQGKDSLKKGLLALFTKLALEKLEFLNRFVH